jgi:outer membrane protein insertion porin family
LWRVLLAACVALFPLRSAQAFDTFAVKDIRLEGLQRIAVGTVFNYLAVQIGDRMDSVRAAESIRALFKTGLFQDVTLGRDGDVLVVTVLERPAISDVTIEGNRDIETDKLKEALSQIGLAKGRTFDRAVLDKVEQELQRQYFSRGKYGVKIESKVEELERNRVNIHIEVFEGAVAKITDVNIVGNAAFTDEVLLAQLQSGRPGFLSLFSSRDQYAKQKLAADLETLRSYYLDRGYINFTIDSTQVSITPDKRDVYVTINVVEGERFTIKEVKLAGDLVVSEEEIRGLIDIHPGNVFSRKAVADSSERISQRLGRDGYAFSNINPIPDINAAAREVTLTFNVDPGRRVYVRRVNIVGNSKTRDEVVRREFRQMEGGWIATDKVNRSRVRLQQLGFFEDVNVETPQVPGVEDQVDVNFSVTERSSGSVQAGLGYAQSQGLIVTASVSHDNFLGSGKRVSAEVNNSRVNSIYSFSYTNPYYTLDGISRSLRLFYRKTDAGEANTADYNMDTFGGGVDFGIPMSEYNTSRIGFSAEHTRVKTTPTTPQEYEDYLANNTDEFNALKMTTGWSYDTRNRAIFPESGMFHSVTTEIVLPVGDIRYYKLTTRHKWYLPVIPDKATFLMSGQVGFGDGYDNTSALPFWEHYYAGGISSVRGFRTSSLGPKSAEAGDPLGGAFKVVGNAELIFPAPFAPDSKSFRIRLFYDVGNVFARAADYDTRELRTSTGVSAQWLAPIGPMVFSLGRPLRTQKGDKRETFQFSLGAPL